MEDPLFLVTKGACACFVAIICFCRATKMDNRVRRFVMWTYVLLAMSATGIALSFIMPPFMLKVCVVGFLGAVCCLLIDHETLWRQGIPDHLLRPEYQWPFMDRRVSERRRPGGTPPRPREDREQ